MRIIIKVFCIAAGLLLVANAVFAGIGENFEKDGTAFWGGATIYHDFEDIINSDTESRWSSFRLAPGADFYIADNLSISVSPYVYYTRNKQDADNIYKAMTIGISGGLNYAFVKNPDAQTGFVPSIGGELGLYVWSDLDDTVGGVTDEDDASQTYASLAFRLRLYKFLRERIAIYAEFKPQVYYYLSMKDDAGNKITDLYDFNEKFLLDATIYVGFAWFVPTKEASLTNR